MKLSTMFVIAGAIVTLAGASPAAFSQTYPAKPVRVIIPFPPGQATDVIGRVVSQKLAEVLGKGFVVENKAGANGIIGIESAVQSAPDGYTLLVTASGSLVINPSVYKKLSYEPLKDLAPIALLGLVPLVVVAHPSLPATSIQQLVTAAKAKPGALSYASSGPGSAQHLAMELLKWRTGMDILHVPYKGSAPAVADLIAGHVKVMFDNLASSWPYVKQGTLRALGVTGPQRDPLAPDVPAIAETLPGYDATSWAGLLAPAKTPPAIVAKISASVQRAIKMLDVAEKFKTQGATPVGDTADHFAKYLKEDIEKWRAVVQKAGVKID